MPDSGSPHEFKRRLLRRYFVRFHMALILFAVIMSGVLASRLLLGMGVLRPLVRYPLSVVISYGVFLGLVRLWIWFVTKHRAAGTSGTSWDLADLAGDAISEVEVSGFAPGRVRAVSSGGGSSGGWGGSIDFDLEEGWFIVLVLAILIGAILGAGAYLIYMAPELLTEAAFQAALASGLSRVVKRAEGPGWAGSVVRGTVIPFAAVLSLSIALAWVMRLECPTAVRLREAIHCPEAPR